MGKRTFTKTTNDVLALHEPRHVDDSPARRGLDKSVSHPKHAVNSLARKFKAATQDTHMHTTPTPHGLGTKSVAQLFKPIDPNEEPLKNIKKLETAMKMLHCDPFGTDRTTQSLHGKKIKGVQIPPKPVRTTGKHQVEDRPQDSLDSDEMGIVSTTIDKDSPKRTFVSKMKPGSAVFPSSEDLAAMDAVPLSRSQSVEDHLAQRQQSARFRSTPTQDSTSPYRTRPIWAVSETAALTESSSVPLSSRTFKKPPSLVGVFVAEPLRKPDNYALKSPFATHDAAPSPAKQISASPSVAASPGGMISAGVFAVPSNPRPGVPTLQLAAARVVRKTAPLPLRLTAGPTSA